MGRYLDLLGDPDDRRNAQSPHGDKSDKSDKSHATVDGDAQTRASKQVRSLRSLLSQSHCVDPRPAAEASDPATWRDLFEERAAIRQFDGRAAAERLAWGDLQNRWHMAHGEKVPRHLCAGCRRPIGEAPALDLIDGCRVHDDAGHDCLIRWGERWRDAATRALVALGLSPPVGADDPVISG